MLSYFPKLREAIDIRKIEFTRPRAAVINLLGEENQSCPCLILADSAKAKGLPTKQYKEHTFINDDKAIVEYLARNYGISRPSHD